MSTDSDEQAPSSYNWEARDSRRVKIRGSSCGGEHHTHSAERGRARSLAAPLPAPADPGCVAPAEPPAGSKASSCPPLGSAPREQAAASAGRLSFLAWSYSSYPGCSIWRRIVFSSCWTC